MGLTMAMRVGLIGAGYMGREHAKAFASLSGASIVGVVGRTPTRATELARAYGARAFDSIAALYAEGRPDAVVVSTPELSTRDVCAECFRHSAPMLVEKPVGVDLAQAREILGMSASSKAKVFVALNRRAYSATRVALAELDRDDSPRLISVQDQQDMVSARASGQPERVVQNWMYANSIHLVDYFQAFGRGRVTSVEVTKRWTPDAPRAVVATVHFSSGDTGVYQAVWDGPGPWAVTVTNRQTRYELRPLEKLSVQRRGERKLTEMPTEASDTECKAGLRHQAQQFLAEASGTRTSLPTLEDATASMELCARIYGLA